MTVFLFDFDSEVWIGSAMGGNPARVMLHPQPVPLKKGTAKAVAAELGLSNLDEMYDDLQIKEVIVHFVTTHFLH